MKRPPQEMESPVRHKPVLTGEAIDFLRLKKGDKVLDGTVGCGGHAGFILQKISPRGILIGVDRDRKSLEFAGKRLSEFGDSFKPVHANFTDIDRVLSDQGIEKVDAALFDLGISSYQLEDAARGFSINRDGALDMRMDSGSRVQACDIVNRCKREDLERIIRDFGEERYWRRVAAFILERRKSAPIKSTSELADLVRHAIGKRYGFQKIHPATRTFQALRIAVNEELENLSEVLGKIVGFLSPNARLAIISFHSLEDRIVKVRFKEFEKAGKGRIITKKPLRACESEIRENPRSRSAKLRVFEKHESTRILDE